MLLMQRLSTDVAGELGAATMVRVEVEERRSEEGGGDILGFDPGHSAHPAEGQAHVVATETE